MKKETETEAQYEDRLLKALDAWTRWAKGREIALYGKCDNYKKKNEVKNGSKS